MYKPNPIKTDHIRLPDDLAELTEQIAAQVHDIWAQGRIAAGQTFFTEATVENRERVDRVKLYLPARTALVLEFLR